MTCEFETGTGASLEGFYSEFGYESMKRVRSSCCVSFDTSATVTVAATAI